MDDTQLDRLVDGEALRSDFIEEAVEQLAELKASKRDLESHIERLQSAITAHAKESGLKELRGSAHKIMRRIASSSCRYRAW